MTPTGCTTCDTHGPELPGGWLTSEETLTLHRASHDLWRALLAPLAQLLRKATK